MKKHVAIFILVLMIFLHSAFICAAPNNIQQQTRTILRRTEAIIITSYKLAKKTGVYTGLGLATSHQIYARKLLQRGSFRKAIFHSLRARILAVDLIVMNKKGIMLNEAKFNQAEENYVDQSPPPEELDQTMKTKEKKVLADDEAVKLLDDLGVSLFGINQF